MSPFVTLLRPKQWIKNLFVWAPLLFANQFHHAAAVQNSLIAVILFCLAASVTYIVNDMKDCEADKLHPVKCQTRPLASEQVTQRQAFLMLLGGYILLGISALWMPKVLGVIGVYLVLNLAYSFRLKQVPVVDIFCIAFGFVLRVYAGAIAIHVPLSLWMFITTFSLALFLACVKRQQELMNSGNSARAVLQLYTPDLIKRYAEMSATSSLMFYCFYVITTHPQLVASVPFVLFGLLRYWWVVENKGQGESPTEALLGDVILMVNIVCWLGAIVVCL